MRILDRPALFHQQVGAGALRKSRDHRRDAAVLPAIADKLMFDARESPVDFVDLADDEVFVDGYF